MAFGGGSDTLVFSTCREADISENTACEEQTASAGDLTLSHTTGMFTGLESIRKIGSGTARLTDLGAAGAMMSLEDGDLRLTEAVLEGYPVRRGSGPDGRSVRFGLRGGSGTRAVSLDMDLRLGASVAPLAEAFSDSRDESAEVELTGEVYAAGLGWRGDAFFSDVALAHGRSRVSSRTLEATGLFRGSFDVKQTHAEARAGRLFPAGGMRITPSVSVFAGSLDHGGHTAEGAVMRAEIPGYSQDYRGCRAGVEVATAEWLELSPALRWRPDLQLDLAHTTTDGPETLTVRKADHAGVISFPEKKRVIGVPREAFRLGLGVTLKGSSDAWSLRLGYRGEWTGGEDEWAGREDEHSVQAGFSIRF